MEGALLADCWLHDMISRCMNIFLPVRKSSLFTTSFYVIMKGKSTKFLTKLFPVFKGFLRKICSLCHKNNSHVQRAKRRKALCTGPCACSLPEGTRFYFQPKQILSCVFHSTVRFSKNKHPSHMPTRMIIHLALHRCSDDDLMT